MDQNSPSHPGTLYIVPTPIGNLEDITLRAIRILREVDLIAAEDTRHTRKLLNHFGITTPLTSYYREKEQLKSQQLIARLQEGDTIALVSDAGTPGIADPGAVIVSAALDLSLPVVPLPGPSALTTALSGAGLGDGGFIFCGFLDAKKGQRQKKLRSLATSSYPLVFYEAPHRLKPMLADLRAILGNRQAFIARELTKKFEELCRGSLHELDRHFTQDRNRGEFVIIVHPGEQQKTSGETIEEMILWYRDNSTLSLKDTARKLASDLGLSRSQVYKQALNLWNR